MNHKTNSEEYQEGDFYFSQVSQITANRIELDNTFLQLKDKIVHISQEDVKLIKFRKEADYNFSIGKLESAISLYKQSISADEPQIMYSYVNLLYLYMNIGEYGLATNCILDASNKICDFGYFAESAAFLTMYLARLKRYDLIEILTDRLFINRREVFQDDIKLFILGFPRCGTTSIAKYFSIKLGLINGPGLALEHFDTIDITQKPAIMLEQFLSSFGYNHNFYTETCASGYYDKSTVSCLNRKILNFIFKYFPDSLKIICTRDAVSRSLSAYKKSANYRKLSFSDVVAEELSIINHLGGIRKIFDDVCIFNTYAANVASLGINHPVLYPSVIMKNFEEFVETQQYDKIVKLNLDMQSCSFKNSYLVGPEKSVFVVIRRPVWRDRPLSRQTDIIG